MLTNLGPREVLAPSATQLVWLPIGVGRLMINVALWLVAIPAAIPFAALCIELAVGLLTRTSAETAPSLSGKTVVLVPAHNEGSTIGAFVTRICSMMPGAMSALVVADNCSDDTASTARAAGATVIERLDPVHRGKGFALAYGRDFLSDDPPDCVIVLDADCTPALGTLEALRDAAIGLDRPVQASNILRPDLDATPMVQISNFAFLVKNVARQKGLARLGGGALLAGTGMAFPWQTFVQARLATGNVTEDLALTVELTRLGVRPAFVEQALVMSDAAAQSDSLVQRSRWEHGFLRTARMHSLPLIIEGVARRNRAAFWLGVHLAVPPLALLFGIGAVVEGVLLVAYLVTGRYQAAAALGFLIMLCVLLVLLSWRRWGRKTLSARAALAAPAYILWKIPLYVRALTGGETRWTRTRRSHE